METNKKGMNALGFFCLGFGAIVGVGWAVSINGWMVTCGGPIPAAIGYLLVLVMMLPIALCYCELVPMLPVAGGDMVFAYKAYNEKIGIIAGWAVLGGMGAIIPWEAIQVTDVLGYLFPQIKSGPILYNCYGSDIYLVVVLIGIVFSLLIFLLNMRGLEAAVKVQKVLCFILISSAVIGAIAALIGGNVNNLKPIYDVTNPTIYGEGLKEVSHNSFFGGCFAIVAMAAYFLTGFETIPHGVEEAGVDVKSVGKMVVLSLVAACVFYAFLLICFGYGWPWQEFANFDRPAASTMFLKLYPGITGKILYWSITLGALAGLFTTWNGFFAACANLMMAMSRGRCLPAFWQKQNKNGVAVNGQITWLIISCCGPFLGANLIDTITCFSGAALIFTWTITSSTLVTLRIKHPEMERPFKIPGGTATGVFSTVVTGLVFIFMFVPSSPFYVGAIASKMLVVWMVVGIILFALCSNRRKGFSREELLAGLFKSVKE